VERERREEAGGEIHAGEASRSLPVVAIKTIDAPVSRTLEENARKVASSEK
jgi:hypothetical protein